MFADSVWQRLTVNLANACVSWVPYFMIRDKSALKSLRLSSIGVESIMSRVFQHAIQHAIRRYIYDREGMQDSDRIPRIAPIISAIMHSMTKREYPRSCQILTLSLSSIMSRKYRTIRNGDTFRQPVYVSYQINSTRHDSLAMIYHMVCITHLCHAVSAR